MNFCVILVPSIEIFQHIHVIREIRGFSP